MNRLTKASLLAMLLSVLTVIGGYISIMAVSIYLSTMILFVLSFIYYELKNGKSN
ncbi:MAG: hypothetical protein MJK08_14610 [Campylobacterales bacterium]|nr:hypothetical protein [Campylobacterales bacterium]